MKKLFKWSGIVIGGLLVLMVLALLAVRMFYDSGKLKPLIERTVENATGRQFVLGGEIKPSLFPWAGVTLTDVSLGNPGGFGEAPFAAFSEFEVRLKLLPLLKKEVQVSRFVLKGLRLDLRRKKDGRVNWEFSKTEGTGKKPAAGPEAAGDAGETLPIETLAVGEIRVSDGMILFVDETSSTKKTLSDVNVSLENVTLNEPISVHFSARLDDKPISLEGSVGPLGDTPGKGRMDIDLTAGAFDVVEVTVTGQVTNAISEPAYQVSLSSSPFSPRRLIREVSPETVLSFSDASALERLSLKARVSGDTRQVSLTDGTVVLDDTTATLQVHVKDVSKPDIDWQLHLDKIDIDRYLPKTEPEKEKPAAAGGSGKQAAPAPKEKTDYAPLRAMAIKGSLTIGELKAGGGTVREVAMKMAGAGGKFKFDPVSMNLYQGSILVRGSVDVTGEEPKTGMNLTVESVQAGPLLKDFIQKDFLTGTANAQISLATSGDAPDRIKRTLNGEGDIRFADGTVKGLNLLGMVRNLQAAFGYADQVSSSGTEFSELACPFAIRQGTLETTDTKLASPVLRMAVAGKADLVRDSLDFRIVPTWVNPIDKKADGSDITGTVVPVLVTGTFSSPKFQPDVAEAAKKAVGKALSDFLDGKSKKSGEEGDPKKQDPVKETVKELLKNLPFGE